LLNAYKNMAAIYAERDSFVFSVSMESLGSQIDGSPPVLKEALRRHALM